MAEYRINMTPTYKAEQLAISQNDVGRELSIYLVGANREAFIIPDGAQITLVGTKPSGLGFTVAGTYSGSTATFYVTAEMSDEAGRIPCEVRITDGSNVIGSSNADLYVETNPHPSDVTDGTAEHVIDTITALVNRAEAAADGAEESTEAAAASAQSAAQSAQAAQDALSEFTEVSVAANTLPAGSQATASYDEGLLTLGIPRGDTGARGETGERGPQGIQGERGERGETGAAGSAATIRVGTVTSGSAPAVTNSGTSSAAVLDFVLQRGETGPAGPQGETGPQGPAYVLTAADKTEITNAVLAQFEDAETIGM